MKTLKELNLKKKRVLVRCDFNVPLDEVGLITDDSRIKEVLPTIEYLLKTEAKVILMSHLDDPKGRVVEKLRLNEVQKKLSYYLKIPVAKTRDCIGKKVQESVMKMKPGELLLLENLRFHKEEEENAISFSKELCKLGDIFINEAFGVCHRSHASIVGVPSFLTSAAGFLLEKEVRVFSKALENPWRPLVVIIGGVKIDTKIKTIEKFLKTADHLLLGSKLAESILTVNGLLVGREFPEKEITSRIKKIKLTNPKIHLPTDGLMSLPSLQENYLRIGAIGTLRKEEEIFDIGPETARLFSEIIKTAKMIIWNGPVGFFEKPPFDKGTKKVAEAICKNYSAFKIAGGGETIMFLKKYGLIEKFDHVSIGGGAMLALLSGGKLPGLEALK